MHGLHTSDLALTLDAARRQEIAAFVRTRSSPQRRVRTAAGAWLVRTGTRLLEPTRDFGASSVGTTGS